MHSGLLIFATLNRQSKQVSTHVEGQLKTLISGNFFRESAPLSTIVSTGFSHHPRRFADIVHRFVHRVGGEGLQASLACDSPAVPRRLMATVHGVGGERYT
jgi:hypothetical protein